MGMSGCAPGNSVCSLRSLGEEIGLALLRGGEQLESFRLAPWASRRRRDLLELMDRLNPTIAELSRAIEQEVEKCPEARRLMTYPGVGALTALAFVLIIGNAEHFHSGKQVASYLGLVLTTKVVAKIATFKELTRPQAGRILLG